MRKINYPGFKRCVGMPKNYYPKIESVVRRCNLCGSLTPKESLHCTACAGIVPADADNPSYSVLGGFNLAFKVFTNDSPKPRKAAKPSILAAIRR